MCRSSKKLRTRGHRFANYTDPVTRRARLLNRIAVSWCLWRGSGNFLNDFNNLGGNRLIYILLDVLLDIFNVLGIYRTSISAPWELLKSDLQHTNTNPRRPQPSSNLRARRRRRQNIPCCRCRR